MHDNWRKFLAVLAGPDQPHAIFAALEVLTLDSVGTLLFTATTHDTERLQSVRLYSSNEDAYPVGGLKSLRPGGLWYETVIVGKGSFAALTIEEIAVVFPDYELIRSLGCESALNLPVAVADRVIGTVNLLHEKGYYTQERVAVAAELLPFATIAFLTAARSDKQG
jgi:hypothetical protein